MSAIQGLIGCATQQFKLDGTNAIDLPIADMTDPQGTASPNFTTMSRGGFTFSTVGFAGNLSTKEYRTYRVEVAHNTDPSKGYEVHFRGTPSDDTTGNAKMFIEYALQKKAGNIVGGSTKSSIAAITSGGNTEGKEYYFAFPISQSDTGLSTMAEGDSLLINMCRLASDAQDTYNGSILLIEFGMHGFVDSTGEQFGD